MASDLTPEELAEEMRQLRYVVRHPMTGDDYPVDTKVIRKLLDMAERCAKAEAEVAKLRERQE